MVHLLMLVVAGVGVLLGIVGLVGGFIEGSAVHVPLVFAILVIFVSLAAGGVAYERYMERDKR